MTDDTYPRIVEVRCSGGRTLTFRVNGPPEPEIFESYEAAVSAELLDVDERMRGVETVRPTLLPGNAIQHAAWWLYHLRRASLRDFNNPYQQRADRLLKFFRQQRAQRPYADPD